MKHIFKVIGALLLSGFAGIGFIAWGVSKLNFEISPIQAIKIRIKVKEREFVKHLVYPAIIRLHDNHGDFFCSAFVVDASYAITAAHCLVDSLGYLSRSPIRVTDSDGEEITVAKAAGINNRVDYGIVTGDFSNFNQLEMDASVSFYSAVDNTKWKMMKELQDNFETCGYPQGQKDVYCADFAPTGNAYFQVAGIGQVFPGMSGGPLINKETGEAVGIISAMSDGQAIVTPIVGILGNFGLEQ